MLRGLHKQHTALLIADFYAEQMSKLPHAVNRSCAPGSSRGRRYRKLVGEDRYQYMAIYEFASEEVLQQFLKPEAHHAQDPGLHRRAAAIALRPALARLCARGE